MPILNVFAIVSDHVNCFIPTPRDTGQEIKCNSPALLDLAPCDPVHPIYSLVFPASITVHVMSFPLSEGSLRFPHRSLLFGPPVIAWHPTCPSCVRNSQTATNRPTRASTSSRPRNSVLGFLPVNKSTWPPRSKPSMRRFAQTSTRITFARLVRLPRSSLRGIAHCKSLGGGRDEGKIWRFYRGVM